MAVHIPGQRSLRKDKIRDRDRQRTMNIETDNRDRRIFENFLDRVRDFFWC